MMLDRPGAVGEGRAVRRRSRCRRRRWPAGCRRRRRRSSPGSPAGGRAGRWRSGAAAGSSWFGSRSRISEGPRRPSQSVSGCSWSKASVGPSVTISSRSWFLWPAEIWLTTTEPLTPAKVRNSTSATSSVVTARRGPPAAAVPNAGTWASVCARSGTAVTSSEHTDARRSPVTNSTRSHQCEPMSAKAREGPDSSASTRQLSSCVGRQPVLQVAAVDEAHGERTVGDAGPGLADHRVEAVDERDRRHAARPVGQRPTARPPPPDRWPAASRTRRACPPRGPPAPGAGAGGSGCRCGRRRRRGTSRGPRRRSRARRRAGSRPRRWSRGTTPPPRRGGRQPGGGRGRGPRR